ncbi:MAG: hypothetical protein J5765_01180 [Clostridia bacterium]|nr:hypothetical protein [Clostridia bacterium]
MKTDLVLPKIHNGQTTYSQAALIGVLAVIATKFCTLPAILAGIAGSKAVWAALILVAAEIAILGCALSVAKQGGLSALPLKKGVRVPLALLFLVFFALKLTALSREIASYFALSLFENVAVLPILILLLLTAALLAEKGYRAIGRMLEILIWLFLFVILFVLVFTRTEGDLFNALGMLSPDLKGLGEGAFKGAAWFGDGVILAFLDLSNEKSDTPAEKKTRGRITFAAAFASVLIVVTFYAVFTSVYGDAAKMTNYAFIKLSAFKANADELGSADWPVIILWSVVSCLYLALLFLSGKESLRMIGGKEDSRKSRILSFLLLGGTATILSTLFLAEEGDYAAFMTKVMSVVTILAAAASVGVGIYAIKKGKGEMNEKAN